MKRMACLFCLLIFISFSLFADDRFEMVTCWNLVNINYEIYVELKYNTSTPIFVSDELVTGFFYSEEDECFIADTPDLKYCSAFGSTPNEALEEMLIAQKLWIEEARANEMTIPLPKYRPLIYQVG